jgi:hypothetical protein
MAGTVSGANMSYYFNKTLQTTFEDAVNRVTEEERFWRAGGDFCAGRIQ